MSALPTPQPAFRYTHTIEELHEFFADNNLYFGVSTDIIPLAQRLQESPDFRDQMTSMIQAICVREGRSMPAAELLEIVANAIGGPLVYKSSPDLNEPLSQVYDFLAAVPQPPTEQGAAEIISFPSIGREEAPIVPDALSTNPDIRTTTRRGETYPDATIARPRLSVPGPSFRKLLMVAGFAVLVAVVLAIVLRPRAATLRQTAPAVPATVTHAPKPTAYGPAFSPTPPPSKHRNRRKAADPDQPVLNTNH